MRTLTVIVVVGMTLLPCLLLVRWQSQRGPQGRRLAHRRDHRHRRHPGVALTELTFHDVDSGTGYKGLLLQGAFSVEGEAQKVVDDALLRASDVLGRESSGVRIKLSVAANGAAPQRIDEFGYPGIGNGEALWDTTR